MGFGGGATDAAGKLLPVEHDQVLPIARGPISGLIRSARQIKKEGVGAAQKVNEEHKSFVALPDDITWGAFETKEAMVARVKATVETRTNERPGQTCIFVSHGSPTMDGFRGLIGAPARGRGGMCAISLLVRDSSAGPWRALVENDATHADAAHEG